jgi:single-strand DNA-binding protein
MPSYNRVILIGRLTRDPELRYTAGGLAVTKFSIAVDRRFKNQQGERVTDFFDCTAWRQKAEFVANYVGRGRLVAVEGTIEINEATGQDGVKKRYTNIVCDNVEPLESQRDPGGEGGGGQAGGYSRGGGQGNAGPNAGGGGGGGADDGYFPDEEPMQAAPRGGVTTSRSGAGGGAPRAAAGPPAGARRPAEPVFPAEDDFDDSDPFADQ